MPENELQLVRAVVDQRPPLASFPDHTIFQSCAWLDFVTETQGGTPIIAEVRHDAGTVGWFTGVLVRRFGLKILGSPFPGWTTAYMGFNLTPDVSRRSALRALIRFAFGEMGCVHFELMDRRLELADAEATGCAHRFLYGFEIDLKQSEEQLFAGMSSSCRRCIRKAEHEGITVTASDDPGFANEYYMQLQDVFRKQGLAPTYGVERVRSLIKHLLPTGNLLLARATIGQGECIATGIFPAMNDTMYFWGGASWRPHQHLRPNEAVQWFAMHYWKARGIVKYDMGGGGEYKRKYGGKQIAVPWMRKSRNRAIAVLRDLAPRWYAMRQRMPGVIGRESSSGDVHRVGG